MLYGNGDYVFHPLAMAHRGSALPLKLRTSYGTHFLDHLAADGAGFAGGEVAVVAVLEVDTDLVGGLHLELVHGLTGLGDIDAVAGGIAAGVAGVVGALVVHVVVHGSFSPFFFWEAARFPKEANRLTWEYYVPDGGGYVWRLAGLREKDGKEIMDYMLIGFMQQS